MLWLLESLRSDDPITVAYGVYSSLSIVAALVFATMLVVPRLRSKLFTNVWTGLLFAFGAIGAMKFVFFSLTDIYAWNRHVATVLIVAIGLAFAVTLLGLVAMWLRACLRGPNPLRRLVREGLFVVAMAGGLFLLDFVEKRYHVPAFWIAMGMMVPCFVVWAWWDDKRRAREWAAGTEQRQAEHRLKVIEELSKDPADADTLASYLKATPEK